MSKHVLDHNHGSVDDEPEIDRTHRQQVRRLAAQQHDADGEEQRERDGRGDDDGAAQIAKEDKLHHEYQHDAEDHVVQHGARGDIDQLAAVVDLFDMHPGRQDVRAVDLRHLRLDALYGGLALLAAPHEDDALNDVFVPVLAANAETRLVTRGDSADVAQQHRRAVVRGQHGVADVVHRMHETDTAHHRRLLPEVHGLTADVDVAVVEDLQHLLQGEAVVDELVEIDGDVIGLGLAAPAVDVDDARHRLEAALEDPVLDGLEVHDGIAGWTDHAVAVDLADRAPRRDLRCRAVGQGRELGEPIDHPLLGLLIGEVVGELHFHVRKAEERDGSHRRDMRDTGHLDLDRDGDVALDLLGRLTRALGDDVDQRRHRIGLGFDGGLAEAADPGAEQKHQQDDHEDPLSQGECHDLVHGSLPRRCRAGQSPLAARSMNSVPLVTTFSPGSSPARTSTLPSMIRPTRMSRTASDWSSRATQTRAVSPS